MKGSAVIAEVKKASPSKGIISKDLMSKKLLILILIMAQVVFQF